MKKFILILIFFSTSDLFAQSDDSSTITSDSILYSLVDSMPEFISGNDSLETFFNRIINPSDIKNLASVNLIFIVERNGEISNLRWVYVLGYGVDKLLKSAMIKMPKWKPGKLNGQNVRVLTKINGLTLEPKKGCTIKSDNEDFLQNMRKKFDELFRMRNHSVFFKDAVNEFENNNFKKAIRNFDKSIIGVPYDLEAWEGRIFSYLFLFEETQDTNYLKIGCRDLQYLSYLSDLTDSTTIDLGLSYCPAEYFFNGEYFLSNGIIPSPNVHSDSYKHELIDSDPEFPGGVDSLYSYLSSNFILNPDFQYSEFKIRVLVKFKISKTGEVQDAFVIVPVPEILRKEACRLAINMPKWKPAIKDGKPIDTDYIFPILNFKYKSDLFLKNYIDHKNYDYNQGVRLISENKINDALISFTAAIKKDRYNLSSYYNRGICFYKMGDKDKSCRDWSYAAYFSDWEALKLINKFCDSLIVIGVDSIHSSFLISDESSENRTSESHISFPGGWYEFEKFIAAQLKIPPGFEKYNKTIYISCIINKNGEVIFPKIITACPEEIKNEIIRLIGLLPKFIPATRNEKPIDSSIIISVSIKKN